MPNTRTSVAPFLAVLQEAVSRLPSTVPCASMNDPIYRHFHESTIANDARAFQTFERAYQRCFRPSPESPPNPNNVMRGEYGMGLIISYLEDVAKLPTMNSDELKLIALRIQELQAPKLVQCNSGGRRTGKTIKNTPKAQSSTRATTVPDGHHSDPYDTDYTPGVEFESSGEELDMEAENDLGILGFGKVVSKQVKVVEEDRDQENVDLMGGSTDIEDESASQLGPRPGKSPAKGNWAMTHFDKTPTPEVRANGVPVWSFRCKWCRGSRNVPRTLGCTQWDKERPNMKSFSRSNFISHIELHCNKVLNDQRYYNTTRSAQSKDVKKPGINGQTLNQQEFSSALAKAVVRDNHAMTFGEGDGMIQFFRFLLPNIRLPAHQTLQRYLYRLFDVLEAKVKSDLKAVERHAISTDAWTSKNSIYALSAVILFFIDKDWHLRELVLDVINLDAEHSGAHMGKLIYRSLKTRETAHRAIACVTDNASANAVMNDTLARRIQERENVHVHGKSMSFTCVNHAFHLVCTDILSHLGVIEPGDHYSDVKGSEIDVEDKSDDGSDIEDTTDTNFEAEFDSDSEADLLEELGLELETRDGDGVKGKSKGGASNRGRQAKLLNVAEKIHEIVVYATASPKRRKNMHQIISRTCSGDARQLSLKKSMRIRWGSVWVEAKRAIKLRPAITHFISTLDTNKPRGKSLERARKLQERWAIKSEEWDLLVMLVDILTPFHTATEAMSRRDVPTLAEVLPTFALLERKLADAKAKLRSMTEGHAGSASAQALLTGIEAGSAKLEKYRTFAHQSDLCLVASVLNPRLRLKYLEKWPETHSRAGTLFAYIFENYRVKLASATDQPTGHTTIPSNNPPPKPTNSWDNEIYFDIPSFVEQFDRELQDYLNGSYQCPPGMDILSWWRVHNIHFPTVAYMSRDFLCIPAASVSVERLFSQCKLTMTDVRSSMSFETARRRICCQHWMKAGVGASDVVHEVIDND